MTWSPRGLRQPTGSDAVAGAVNYILDHDFTGMKVEASSGISKHGDSFDYRAGVAGGFDLGDRGHFMFSLERFETEGIKMKDRGSQGTISYIAAGKTPGGGPPGTAGNPLVIYENARWVIISDGGHALGGPLFGTYFPRAGEYRFFDFGTPTGSGASVVGGDGTALQIDQTITEDAASNQAFFRLDYDFGAVRANVMGVYSIADVDVTSGFNYFDFGQAVYSGNPFIPAGAAGADDRRRHRRVLHQQVRHRLAPVAGQGRYRSLHHRAGPGRRYRRTGSPGT